MCEYTIYGRNDCEYCIKAINLCVHNGTSFSFINMENENISKDQLSNKLNTQISTVPQVLFNQQYIGGSDDLENHFAA